MTFLELNQSITHLQLLEWFYAGIYVPEFPDPDERESLDNMERYLELKAEGWYGKNNYHILVVMEDEKPIAGSITDYLAEANAGVIEFLLVDPEYRGQGIAKQLLEFTEATLKKDAQNSLSRDLDLIVGEMNDPFKSGNAHDNLDPFERAKIWHKWGYQKLDFPYIQPALSSDQIPVRHLLLMGKILNPDYSTGLPSDLVKLIVHEYLRWAMRIEQPDGCGEYQEMARYLDDVDTVNTIPLRSYVGYDDTKPLAIEEITSIDHPDIDNALTVYHCSFSDSPVTALSDDFKNAISASSSGEELFNFHFWSLRSAPENPVEGMASFFTFPNAGFGGYLTLSGTLKGNGRLRLLLARMEELMIKDNKNASGWYIECEPHGQHLIFNHLGFREIAINYRQPPLEGQPKYDLAETPDLRLMYKDFGNNYHEPQIKRDEFLNSIEWVYRIVYKVPQPKQSLFFQDMEKQVAAFKDGFVIFRQSLA